MKTFYKSKIVESLKQMNKSVMTHLNGEHVKISNAQKIFMAFWEACPEAQTPTASWLMKY